MRNIRQVDWVVPWERHSARFGVGGGVFGVLDGLADAGELWGDISASMAEGEGRKGAKVQFPVGQSKRGWVRISWVGRNRAVMALALRAGSIVQVDESLFGPRVSAMEARASQLVWEKEEYSAS